MHPPDLIRFEAFGGNWIAYEAELYRIFQEEIAHGGLRFRGQRVSCRRMPETARRWSTFWHLVQEGRAEEDRTPDLRRCERIRWIRWVVENAESHPEIGEWRNERRGKINALLCCVTNPNFWPQKTVPRIKDFSRRRSPFEISGR